MFWWPFSWWRWTWVDCSKLGFINNYLEFTALTLLVGRQEGHPACKITEWWGAGVVICLERGADLHTAQLMPLPLIVSCFSKIQIGFTFLVPAHAGSPRQRAIKRVCVCACVRACMRACVCGVIYVLSVLGLRGSYYGLCCWWRVCDQGEYALVLNGVHCIISVPSYVIHREAEKRNEPIFFSVYLF